MMERTGLLLFLPSEEDISHDSATQIGCRLEVVICSRGISCLRKRQFEGALTYTQQAYFFHHFDKAAMKPMKPFMR
jgi:hypothetical protein